MYAIVRTGGKQYRVEEGRSFDVELLPAKEGASVELDNVLLIADDGNVTVGTPIIEGARVIADVESHGRQKKIVVFKFKAKVRTRKKTGHRQHFTRLAVTEILRPGQESKASAAKKAAPKRKTRKSTAKAAAADTPVAEADVTAAAPEEKAPPTKKAAPKRTRKPAAAKASAAPEAGKKASPKRRTRKPAAPKAKAAADAGAESDDKATAEKKPARKRPSRRATKKAGEDKE
ncbi:MAG: 50S ribosomal protein L21 [Chloroflexi bacterium]|nr:50S ribosomal protein L21 [Chloroflexota bacterium]